MKALTLLLPALLAVSAASTPFGERRPYQVESLSPDQLQQLALAEVDVDHWNGGAWTLWLDPAEVFRLRDLGLAPVAIPNPVEAAWREWINRPADAPRDDFTYRTYAELTTELQGYAATYPGICRLASIGTSIQGRSLWALQIGDNPDTDEDEPEVKLVSTMHGDEVVGTVLLLNLVEDLLQGYGTDFRLTTIVDQVDLHVLVLMNPDGMQAGQRYNAAGADLNRDFPDRINDAVNTVDGRQPETAAVMQWTWGRNFDLSLNYHGGALVANYGYDGNSSGSPVYTIAPDDELFIELATTYSASNAPMFNSSVFTNGITNGADWYVIYGGMQDWCYVWEGGVDVTVEVSTTKWPAENTLPGFWNNNRESLLQYVESSLKGIRGIVRDADTQLPVEATVRLAGIASDDFSSAGTGDYHRLCVPGTWTLVVSAPGYATVSVPGIVVGTGAATVVDVDLQFVGLPETILQETFATTTGWTLEGSWSIAPAVAGGGEHGNPDPAMDTSTGSDNRILGHAIGADYPNGLTGTQWAVSPVWDLSDWGSVQVSFRRWLGLERNLYDHGFVQSWNGTAWVPLWENGSTSITENAWSTQTFDVSASADGNPGFRLRFGLGPTDAAWRYCGWNLDDLELAGYATGPLASPAVTILLEGTSVQLAWQPVVGAISYRVESATFLGGVFTAAGTTMADSFTLPGHADAAGQRLYRVVAMR